MSVMLLVIVAIVAISCIIGLYQKQTNGICTSKRRLDGKTALVTGGTTGIGLEIATDFAQRGAKVIIACPFEKEGTEARKTIIKNTDNDNIIFKLLDLGSLDSVRKFAADIIKTEDRLDILMNNAGVGIPGDYLTKDGLNFILQVNYLGHFLLTLLLLPLLKKTASSSEPSRIVCTSSILNRIGNFEVDNMNRTGYWYPIQIYGNSKLYMMMFSRELTARLKGSNVVINSVNPGFVGTRIYDYPFGRWPGSIVTLILSALFKNSREGAQTAIHVCVDDKAGKISGELFKDCKVARAKSVAYDDKLTKVLWEESVKCVKLDNKELDQCFKSL